MDEERDVKMTNKDDKKTIFEILNDLCPIIFLIIFIGSFVEFGLFHDHRFTGWFMDHRGLYSLFMFALGFSLAYKFYTLKHEGIIDGVLYLEWDDGRPENFYIKFRTDPMEKKYIRLKINGVRAKDKKKERRKMSS